MSEKIKKKAIITGITGQDGSYLAEFLLEKNYEVHGVIRPSSTFNTVRIVHLYTDPDNFSGGINLHYGDLTDISSLISIFNQVQPDEVYNLGALSHVKTSFDLPEYTASVVGVGVVRILEAIRQCGLKDKTKLYQASTSEMFGDYPETPQSENTPLQPCSPYGAAKVYAHHMCRIYREGYGIFVSCGILFNHESPRRGVNFVTKKVTRGVARIKLGFLDHIVLGNLEASRDWGHAKDYVEAMWLILQKSKPDDYVISTSYTCTVREFVLKCFRKIGLELTWSGSGLDEVGKDQDGIVRVKVSQKYFRPKEVNYLLGDYGKARVDLGWSPKYNIDDIVDEMISEDIKLCKENRFY